MDNPWALSCLDSKVTGASDIRGSMWALCLRCLDQHSSCSTTRLFKVTSALWRVSRSMVHLPHRGEELLPQVPALALKSGVALNRAGQALLRWSHWYFSFNPLTTPWDVHECPLESYIHLLSFHLRNLWVRLGTLLLLDGHLAVIAN